MVKYSFLHRFAQFLPVAPTRFLAVAALLIVAPLVKAEIVAPAHVDVKRGPVADAIHADIARRVPEGFAGAIIIEKEGVLVLKAGYGWANRQRHIPFTTSTIAQVGSLTKQFTATAIVDLSLQGKLDVTDPLSRHLAGVPARAAGITIHELLTHTAGLPDNCGGDFDRMTRDELITGCLARVELLPGSKFAYSNLGYSLLAAVVESVSGMALEDYLARRFFKRLGLNRTGYFFNSKLLDRLAFGYAGSRPQPPISDRLVSLKPAFWNLKGNGGMQASGDDMYSWFRALAQGPVIGSSMRRTLMAPHARRDDEVAYGYGWFVRSRPGGEVEQVSHTGGDGVFFAAFVWRPKDRIFFYLVSNNGNDTGAGIASAVLKTLRDPSRIK